MKYDVIIIGSGVAGLMAAGLLKDRKVLILEKCSNSGKKLLITGNGRCNLTNLKTNKLFLDNVEYNKKYLYSTINLFGPKEICEYFKSIKLKEEEDNKIFPVSNKASDILNFLMEKIKYKINYNEEVLEIDNDNGLKKITTKKNTYLTNILIIATGGASYKETGSSGDHIKFCENLKQPFVNLFPAETGVILDEKNELAGTSFDNVYIKNIKKNGNLMFTHKGLSGTSIMKSSEFIYLNNIKEIYIDFLPDYKYQDINDMFIYDKKISDVLNLLFTKKFSLYLLEKLKIENIKFNQISKKKIFELMNLIKNHKFDVKKVNDIEYAYVTGGGVDLKYLNPKNFESKIHSGIYFIGECLDIHGPIGGYNITLALSTAYSCVKNIKERGIK